MTVQKGGRGGFTLIELLGVVLIIGLLASIAQYFKVVEKSRMAEAMSMIAAIMSAQERYVASGGQYTQNFTDLDITYPNATASGIVVKFFAASMINGTSINGPNYKLTLARHSNSASVATRYGNYAITLNVPDDPILTIGSCPGGAQIATSC